MPYSKAFPVFREQGWRSGESTRLPPIWPGSNPSVNTICGLSLFLVLSLAPSGFSLGTPVFPSPQKLTFPNSNSTRNQVDKEPLGGCAACKQLFIIYLFFKVLETSWACQIYKKISQAVFLKIRNSQAWTKLSGKTVTKAAEYKLIKFFLLAIAPNNSPLFLHAVYNGIKTL